MIKEIHRMNVQFKNYSFFKTCKFYEKKNLKD